MKVVHSYKRLAGEVSSLESFAAEASGVEVARDFGPGPALPEDDADNSREDAHDGHPAAGGESARIGPQKISLEELNGLRQGGGPVTILDVRTERSLEGEGAQAKGAVRMPPDHVAERARELGLEREAWLVAYCA